jgi:hypothetical protein
LKLKSPLLLASLAQCTPTHASAHLFHWVEKALAVCQIPARSS